MRLAVIFFLLIGTIGCQSDPPKTKPSIVSESVVKPAVEPLLLDTLLGNIACTENKAYSYAAYLPTKISGGADMPIIFLLDPDGSGETTIRKYIKQAKSFGFGLVCSNNSKNGMAAESSVSLGRLMIQDCLNRLPKKTNSIYLGGFSGGARVAGLLAPGVDHLQGLLLFSAGIDPTGLGSVPLYLAAGRDDANYSELLGLHLNLLNSKQEHRFIVWDGGHSWPDEMVIERLLYALDLKRMKAGTKKRDEAFITEYLKKTKDQRRHFQKIHDEESDLVLLKESFDNLTGLTNTDQLQSELEEPQTVKNLQRIEAEQIENMKVEENKKQIYLKSLLEKDIAWWKDELTRLQRSDPKGGARLHSNKRMLGFLGLAVFSYTKKSMEQVNPDGLTQKLLSIYFKLEPNNADAFYFSALYFAKRGETENALSNLTSAAANGFKDKSRLQQEPSFAAIRGTGEFQKILNTIP